MPKFLTNIGRMFASIRSIMQKMFAKATKSTGSVFKMAGETLATIIAGIIATTLLAFIIMVSIPVTMYGDIKEKTRADVVNIDGTPVPEETANESPTENPQA